MSDFESRVRDALQTVAGGAPAPGRLAMGARRRARNRRRATLVASTIAVAAAVAVPSALAFGGLDAEGPAAPDPSLPVSSSSTSPIEPEEPSSSERVETWRNLEIRVPGDWGYGNLSTWCLGGRTEPGAPVVERPEGAVRSIRCQEPASGYGVQFFDPAAYDPAYPPGHVRQIAADGSGAMPFPVGAWVGYQYAGDAGADAAVLVVARSEDVAHDVLESARLVEGEDGNGCATRLEDSPGSTSGLVSVCRYTPDGWLEQSELLSPEDSDSAIDALSRAPLRQDQLPCPATPERYPVVVLGAGTALGAVRVVWASECPGARGVFFSGVARELTQDVMYWALSPGWSGGVDGDVPLPPELR